MDDDSDNTNSFKFVKMPGNKFVFKSYDTTDDCNSDETPNDTWEFAPNSDLDEEDCQAKMDGETVLFYYKFENHGTDIPEGTSEMVVGYEAPEE